MSGKHALLSVVLTYSLILGACAREAVELPPDLSNLPPEQRLTTDDRGSAEFGYSCAELREIGQTTVSLSDELEGRIRSNRGKNQAVSFLGGMLFPPAVLLVSMDDDAKDVLNRLQVKRDRIQRIRTARNC
jgi:hypothetical protein